MKVAIWGSALLALSWTGEAVAAKRPWDADRYTECMRKTGEDALAPTLQIFTNTCRTGREPVEASEGLPGTVDTRASVAGAIAKDDPSKAFVGVFVRTSLERSDTFLGGSSITSGGTGGLTYRSIHALVSGERKELEATFTDMDRQPCSRISRGSISVRSCTYVQVAGINLPQSLRDELKARYAAEPEGVFRLRVGLDEGSITLTVPLAEIEAVRRVIEATPAG